MSSDQPGAMAFPPPDGVASDLQNWNRSVAAEHTWGTRGIAPRKEATVQRRIRIFCLLTIFSVPSAVAAARLYTGYFALQGQAPRAEAHLNLLPVGDNPLLERIDIWMTGPSSETIRNYSVEMTKRLHVIIVSSDFSTFLHIHPQLGADGHFYINERFPRPGLYHLYADGVPDNFSQQVFRFDITVGHTGKFEPPILTPTGSDVLVGPYTVQLDETKVRASGTEMLEVHILKNGKPAEDLHPYLGASAHAVFINSSDLTYVHVHPMAMTTPMNGMDLSAPARADSASASPDMMLHVSMRESGTYKLWLQFRGGSQLYVAPFILSAE
jgi:hypothetical protein